MIACHTLNRFNLAWPKSNDCINKFEKQIDSSMILLVLLNQHLFAF